MPDMATLVGGVIAAILVVAILSGILLWLWNTTMPDVFGLKTINFWQALKLLLIAGILFGSPTVIDYGSDAQSIAASQSGE